LADLDDIDFGDYTYADIRAKGDPIITKGEVLPSPVAMMNLYEKVILQVLGGYPRWDQHTRPFQIVESGVCYCGEEMDTHSPWYATNHTPTDQPWIERDLITSWFCRFMGMSPK
jgi:hypothetical protein